MDPSEVSTEYFTNRYIAIRDTHFNPSKDNTGSRGGNMLQLLLRGLLFHCTKQMDFSSFLHFSLSLSLSSSLFLSFENGGQRKTCHRFLFSLSLSLSFFPFSQRDERTHVKTTQVIWPNKAPSFHGYTFHLLVHPLNSRAESRLCRYRARRFSFSFFLLPLFATPFSLSFLIPRIEKN